jgi:hypothetical protein
VAGNCNRCGASTAEGDRFCAKCGGRLQATEPEGPEFQFSKDPEFLFSETSRPTAPARAPARPSAPRAARSSVPKPAGGAGFLFAEAPRPADASPEGPRFCSQCGTEVAPDTKTCLRCAAPIVDVLLMTHLAPLTSFPKRSNPHPVETSLPMPENLPAERRGFQWKWFMIAAGFILLAAALSMLLLGFVLAGLDIEDEDLSGLLFFLFLAAGIFVGAFKAALRSPGRTIREPALAAGILAIAISLAFGADLAESAVGALLPLGIGLLGAWLGEKYQAARQG